MAQDDVFGTARLDGELDRRSLLRRALVGTSLGAGYVFAEGAQAAHRPGHRPRRRGRGRNRFSFDVACRGSTFRVTFPPDANPAGGDLYGGHIMVEGYMYRAGTLPVGASSFDPENDAAHPHVGHWFCLSTFLIHPRRGVPHLLGHQQYVFGRMTADRPNVANQLASHGFEGADSANVNFTRAITGGTGRYSRARGSAVQDTLGTNASVLAQLGGIPAPNFRFTMNLG